jgi:hypothetical protein
MIAYAGTTAPNNNIWFDPYVSAAATVFVLPGGWIEAEPDTRKSRAEHSRTCRASWPRPASDMLPEARETGVLRSGRRSKGSVSAARQLPITWFN